jgi:hypothetical protein
MIRASHEKLDHGTITIHGGCHKGWCFQTLAFMYTNLLCNANPIFYVDGKMCQKCPLYAILHLNPYLKGEPFLELWPTSPILCAWQ